MRDIFEPRNEPARSIYLAFQAEAKKREKRTPEEWQQKEIESVFETARTLAITRGETVLTISEIEEAQCYATGHIDYGAKWAYRVAEKMRNSHYGI